MTSQKKTRRSAREVVYKPSSVYVIIFLLCMSPCNFIAIMGTDGQPFAFQHLAPNGVYSRCMLPCPWVVSYTAFPSLPPCSGGLFLLHSSSIFIGKPLACVFALWCSDFPHRFGKSQSQRDHSTTCKNYYTLKQVFCQLSCLIFSIAAVSIRDT